MTHPLQSVLKALGYACNHRFGDGDVTHMFEEAAKVLREFIERYDIESGLQEDLNQLIRIALTNPNDIRGYIEENYPEQYKIYTKGQNND